MKGIDGAAGVEFDRGGRGARDRIVAAARVLFYRDGIHATGVDELIQYAHVSKRTFYQYFSTKRELVQEYLRDLDATRAIPRERALAPPDAPAARGGWRCSTALPRPGFGDARTTMRRSRRPAPCQRYTTSSTSTSSP